MNLDNTGPWHQVSEGENSQEKVGVWLADGISHTFRLLTYQETYVGRP